jgi:hypothetical protein
MLNVRRTSSEISNIDTSQLLNEILKMTIVLMLVIRFSKSSIDNRSESGRSGRLPLASNLSISTPDFSILKIALCDQIVVRLASDVSGTER